MEVNINANRNMAPYYMEFILKSNISSFNLSVLQDYHLQIFQNIFVKSIYVQFTDISWKQSLFLKKFLDYKSSYFANKKIKKNKHVLSIEKSCSECFYAILLGYIQGWAVLKYYLCT